MMSYLIHSQATREPQLEFGLPDEPPGGSRWLTANSLVYFLIGIVVQLVIRAIL
jgi:hypothetical protein